MQVLEPPPTHIVLVHGTRFFGSRSDWTLPGSDFSKTIERLTGLPLLMFDWGGWNTYRSRVRGAHSLARFLRDLDGPVAIIAHSHGGNVARLAIAIEGRVPAERRRHLITLGTPFVTHSLRERSGIALFARCTWLASVFILMGFTFTQVPRQPFPAWIVRSCSLLSIVIIAHLAWSVVALRRSGIRPKSAMLDTVLNPDVHSSTQTTFLVSGDEAGLALSSLEALGRLSRFARDRYDTIAGALLASWASFSVLALGATPGFFDWIADSDQATAEQRLAFEHVAERTRSTQLEEGRELSEALGLGIESHDKLMELALWSGGTRLVLAGAAVLLFPGVILWAISAAHQFFVGFDSTALSSGYDTSVSSAAAGAQKAIGVSPEQSSGLRHSALSLSREVARSVAAEIQPITDVPITDELNDDGGSPFAASSIAPTRSGMLFHFSMVLRLLFVVSFLAVSVILSGALLAPVITEHPEASRRIFGWGVVALLSAAGLAVVTVLLRHNRRAQRERSRVIADSVRELQRAGDNMELSTVRPPDRVSSDDPENSNSAASSVGRTC